MTTTIALAGKGGVGKTTIAGLIIKYLIETRKGSILAIDADPSSNLNMTLGVPLEWTVGDIREEMLSQVKASLSIGGAAMGSLPGGISKREYLDYQVRSSLAEGDHFDLIAMGRPEGPGCYCAVNHNLREVIDTISKNYDYVVIDNEAGMEHLSRRTTRDVQHLIIVSDCSLRGIVAADRIAQIKNELEINIENAYLVINNHQGPLPQTIEEYIRKMNLSLLGLVPPDNTVTEFEYAGKPLIKLSTNAPIYQAVVELMDKVLTRSTGDIAA